MHIQKLGGDLDAPSEFMNEVKVRIDVLSVPEQATKTTGGGGGSAVSVVREQATKTTGGGGGSAVSVREQATKTTGGGGSAAAHVMTDAQYTQLTDNWRRYQSENENLKRQIERLKSEKEKLQHENANLYREIDVFWNFLEEKGFSTAAASGQCFP